MSDRAADVLAYIDRAMVPDAPMVVDIAARRVGARTERVTRAHLRYVKARLADLALEEELLTNLLTLVARR